MSAKDEAIEQPADAETTNKPDTQITDETKSADNTKSDPPKADGEIKPDKVMTDAPPSPLENHTATVSTLRVTLMSDAPAEQAAEQALQATASHPERNRILLSTLHTIIGTVPFESALRLIDVSTHLPYPARNTISLIEALTNTLTTEKLSWSLPLLQPHINILRARPKSDIYLIKLLQSFISRDPHAANPVLAGRLKLIIASALPVWHLSGMNKLGHYNTQKRLPVPTPPEPALARALTAFTDACRYPPACEQPATWSSARDALKVLLDAFDVGKLTEIQRWICIQAVILFQHLEYDGGNFGKTLFATGEGVSLRRRVWERVEGGLKRFLIVLLQRERRWVRYKRTMEHSKIPKVVIARSFKRRLVRRAGGSGTENMGLTKPSWKTLTERTRGGGVESLIEELREDQKEAAEDRRKGDGKYVWRGLRSLCEENVALMAKVADKDGRVDLERILAG